MSKNTLYLECYEGITGEMVLGALRELAEDVETEERAHAISRGESNCAVTGLSEEGIKRDTEKRGKEHRTTQEELLTRIDSLLDKLQIEKITASPVWSDKGPTDAAGLAIAARAAGVCPERFTVKKVGMGISYVNLENGDRELSHAHRRDPYRKLMDPGKQHRRLRRRSPGLHHGSPLRSRSPGRLVHPHFHEEKPPGLPAVRSLHRRPDPRPGRHPLPGDHHHRRPPLPSRAHRPAPPLLRSPDPRRYCPHQSL